MKSKQQGKFKRGRNAGEQKVGKVQRAIQTRHRVKRTLVLFGTQGLAMTFPPTLRLEFLQLSLSLCLLYFTLSYPFHPFHSLGSFSQPCGLYCSLWELSVHCLFSPDSLTARLSSAPTQSPLLANRCRTLSLERNLLNDLLTSRAIHHGCPEIL